MGPPHQRDPAGAGQLDDPVGADRLDEGLDLLLLPGDLDHEQFGADVHDPAAEDLDQRLDLRTYGGGGLDLDQHQVPLDVVFAGDVLDLDDRYDLLELLPHLFEMPVVSHRHDRDSREDRILRLADREAVDIEAARGEHPRDLGQHARLVLHQGREHVADAPALLEKSLPVCSVGVSPGLAGVAIEASSMRERPRRAAPGHGRRSRARISQEFTS